MTLAGSGISYPCHHLSVCRKSSPNSQEPAEEVYTAEDLVQRSILWISSLRWMLITFSWIKPNDHVYLQCADVHMVSDSEGDDFEDASEFGVDDSEMFGMGSSTCRKSPMSMYIGIRFPIGPPDHN